MGEEYEHRVSNLLLKAQAGIDTPENVQAVLSRNIEILAPAARCVENDLWPAVWATAAVARRQFRGRVSIRAGLGESLLAPATLPGVEFTDRPNEGAYRIGLGVEVDDLGMGVWGDARGPRIAFGKLLSGVHPAHPCSAFALAGYLGVAALAQMAGVPPYGTAWLTDELALPLGHDILVPEGGALRDGLGMIGLGHLGHAYLALLYFLVLQSGRAPARLVVLDRDRIARENHATQILLDEDAPEGELKAQYVERKLRSFGWAGAAVEAPISWGWRRPATFPPVVLLGVDNMPARRIAVQAGFTRVLEAGIGDSLVQPRITWHSLNGDARHAQRFQDSAPQLAEPQVAAAYEARLRSTPGGCGWLTFKATTASAPSFGLVAASFVASELIAVSHGEDRLIAGSARLWSPLLPYSRDLL